MSVPGFLYWLRKLGFRCGRQNKENKIKYKDSIKDISLQSLVYVDESGIDMMICKVVKEKPKPCF